MKKCTFGIDHRKPITKVQNVNINKNKRKVQIDSYIKYIFYYFKNNNIF